jgi:glycosyltransferase involved in cell wall biosynthesis
MRILLSLSYFKPHVSGLTVYVDRLSKALADRGNEVTILTTRHDESLPLESVDERVRVMRMPIAVRSGKAAITLGYARRATALVAEHDIVNVHLPQPNGLFIAAACRKGKTPLVCTFHSELTLPSAVAQATLGRAVNATSAMICSRADAVVAYTDDFAKHSVVLRKQTPRLHIIDPPVEISLASADAIAKFRSEHGLAGRFPVIGLAGRLAAEKGVEYLLDAVDRIVATHPTALVVHAGPKEALGEEKYRKFIDARILRSSKSYLHVGVLHGAELAAFFSACDVQALPSVNNTETFGLVQIEAALCGTPTVASDLPGVRIPTQITGMGRCVPPRNAVALAAALLEVSENRDRYSRPKEPLSVRFAPANVAETYENLFRKLVTD